MRPATWTRLALAPGEPAQLIVEAVLASPAASAARRWTSPTPSRSTRALALAIPERHRHTPHVGVLDELAGEALARLVARNLDRWRQGSQLEAVVDLSAQHGEPADAGCPPQAKAG